MENLVIIGSLFCLAALSLAFVVSPRMFFGMSLIARAIADQLVNVEVLSIGGSSFTFPDILAIFTLLCGFGFLLRKLPDLLASQPIRPALYFLLAFVFLTSFAAIANGPDSLKNAAKVTSWLIYLPVGYALFSAPDGIRLLKKIGLATALVTIASLAVSNIQETGITAYDLGVVYLGFFTSEAVLAGALLSSLVLLLLPGPVDKPNFVVVATNRATIVILILLITALMVRSFILGTFVVFLVYALLSTVAGFIRKAVSFAGVTLLFSVFAAGIYLFSPQQFESRFEDVREYRAGTVDASSLGSGRFGLFSDYFEEYQSRSIEAQLFGFNLNLDASQSATRSFKPKPYGTHNDALEILFLSGLAGLVLYVSMWIAILLTLRRVHKLPLDQQGRRVAALGMSLVCLYGILVFHGAVFYIFLMQTIAVVVGVAIGAGIHRRPEHPVTESVPGRPVL